MAQPDETKLNGFIGKMLGDLGGAFSVPTTRIRHRLGLFDALSAGGPATASELAARAGAWSLPLRERVGIGASGKWIHRFRSAE